MSLSYTSLSEVYFREVGKNPQPLGRQPWGPTLEQWRNTNQREKGRIPGFWVQFLSLLPSTLHPRLDILVLGMFLVFANLMLYCLWKHAFLVRSSFSQMCKNPMTSGERYGSFPSCQPLSWQVWPQRSIISLSGRWAAWAVNSSDPWPTFASQKLIILILCQDKMLCKSAMKALGRRKRVTP